jgi:hypothetical protein
MAVLILQKVQKEGYMAYKRDIKRTNMGNMVFLLGYITVRFWASVKVIWCVFVRLWFSAFLKTSKMLWKLFGAFSSDYGFCTFNRIKNWFNRIKIKNKTKTHQITFLRYMRYDNLYVPWFKI